MRYRFRAKVFTVLVNGQSELCAGEAPYSRFKVAGFVLLLVVLAFTIVAASGGF